MSILKANRIENLTTTDGGININNSGQVAIGVASASKPLHIYQTADAGIRIQNNTTGTGTTDGILLEATGSDGLFWNYESGNLRFATGNSERLRIDSSGNVGIGNSSPSNYSSTGRNLVVGTGSSAAGLTVASGATNTGNIYFAAGSTGDDQVRGQIRYNHSTEAMDLYTDASLRMRVDSSGDVQARRARSNTTGDVALSVQPSDSTIHYGFRIDSTNNSLNLDRASGTATNLLTIDSSGRVGIATTPEAWSGFDALEVNEASIVSSGSGDAFFTANAYYDGAWKYKDAGVARNIYMNSDGIVFRTAPSGSADGSISWTEVGRWREGGGLTFNGDTAAANALDDYEEGTFTPTLALSSPGSSSIGYSNQTGRYVKVGKIVYFSLDIRLSSFSRGTGTGGFQVQGLPVVPVDTNNYHRANGFANLYNWDYASASNQIPTWNVIQDGGVSALDINLHREDNTNTSDVGDPGSTSMVFISGTYEATS